MTPILEGDFSVRTTNLLRKIGITTYDELSKTSEEELGVEKFGKTAIEELRVALECKGFRLRPKPLGIWRQIQNLTSAEIMDRLTEIAAEEKSLRVLLRAARAAENTREICK